MSTDGVCLAEQRVRAQKMKTVSISFFLNAFFFFISPTTYDLVEVEGGPPPFCGAYWV